MKKFGVIATIVSLVLALAMPAPATEMKVSGEFKTQWWMSEDLDAKDGDTGDYNYLQSRARIKVKFQANENAAFNTQFEIGDGVWGDDDWVDFGTDGKDIEVRHAYMDVTMGGANLKVGAQNFGLARNWLIDTDAAGVKLTFNPSDTLSLPIYWLKQSDDGKDATATNRKTSDVDFYAIAPKFSVSEGITVNPYAMWVTSDHLEMNGEYGDYDSYYLGVDVDAAFGPVGVWFTGVMQTGAHSLDSDSDDDDYNLSGYVVNLGGSYTMDTFDVSAEFRYVTGDDEDTNDEDEAFGVIAGNGKKAWSFILGDEDIGPGTGSVSKNNIMVASVGCGVKPAEKVTLDADIYYAQKVETADNEDDDYGVEVNVNAGFELVDNVSLNLLAAYLFAGDAITGDSDDEANPYEMGAALKIKF